MMKRYILYKNKNRERVSKIVTFFFLFFFKRESVAHRKVQRNTKRKSFAVSFRFLPIYIITTTTTDRELYRREGEWTFLTRFCYLEWDYILYTATWGRFSLLYILYSSAQPAPPPPHCLTRTVSRLFTRKNSISITPVLYWRKKKNGKFHRRHCLSVDRARPFFNAQITNIFVALHSVRIYIPFTRKFVFFFFQIY